MIKKLILTVIPLALLLGGVLYFVNHHKSADQQSSNQLRVVTTNSILEDMVRQVAGDKVRFTASLRVVLTRMNTNPSPLIFLKRPRLMSFSIMA